MAGTANPPRAPSPPPTARGSAPLFGGGGDAPRGVLAGIGMNPLLAFGLAVSLLFHGLILSTHFVAPPQPTVHERDRGLEVVLVNARHTRPPEKADMLAQADLDGGGTIEHETRPTTPVPPQEALRDGDALIDAQQVAALPPPAPQPVLVQPKADKPAPKISPQPEQPAPVAEPQPAAAVSGMDLMDSIAAIARMEAKIDRSLNDYAQRPRKTFIGARTREYRFARYVEDWRQKIERIGTLNYPDAARGRLYGSLLLSVVIRADGSIERIDVQRSSGQPVLDEAAVRIVELAAPFAPFPPDIRADTDILEITRTWTFTNTDQVRAH